MLLLGKMMTLSLEKNVISAPNLEDFLAIPETKPAREFFQGNIFQKPMPQGEHSILQMRLGTAINGIGLAQKTACAFPELRCVFGGQAIVPDLAVFTWDKIPRTADLKIANKFTIPPDWLIEILSPEQSTTQLIKKILFSLNQGTQLAWLIDPREASVMVYYPQRLPEIKEGTDTLPGLAILTDWQLTAQELFEWLVF